METYIIDGIGSPLVKERIREREVTFQYESCNLSVVQLFLGGYLAEDFVAEINLVSNNSGRVSARDFIRYCLKHEIAVLEAREDFSSYKRGDPVVFETLEDNIDCIKLRSVLGIKDRIKIILNTLYNYTPWYYKERNVLLRIAKVVYENGIDFDLSPYEWRLQMRDYKEDWLYPSLNPQNYLTYEEILYHFDHGYLLIAKDGREIKKEDLDKTELYENI